MNSDFIKSTCDTASQVLNHFSELILGLFLGGHFPAVVVCVEQMMAALAQGTLEILVVDSLYIAVLMRIADGGIAVQLPEYVAALFGKLKAVMDGLSAAACTSAGAGHDLNKVETGSACADIAHEEAGVSQAADNGNLYLACTGNGEGGFLATLYTANLGEGIGRGILAGNKVIGASQSGVHNTAGGAEDNGCAGTCAKGRIEGSLRQILHRNVLRAEETIHLAGGENNVHIGVAAGIVHLRQGGLALFGNAGHDGYHKHLVGVNAYLLCEIALCHSAEHLLRALGGRKIIGEHGILALDKAYPAGTAGGEHGPLVLVPVGEALYKLASLFHYGEICSEIGIENIVEANALECGDHALCSGEIAVHTQALTPCGTDGGSHLNHGDYFGVMDSGHNTAGIVTLTESTHGAVGDTLAAISTLGIIQSAVMAYINCGACTGAGNIPDINSLNLVAYLNAAHALYALALITDKGQILVPGAALHILVICQRIDVEVAGYALKSAVTVTHAGSALTVMLRENELNIGASCCADTGRIGVYNHALHNDGVAGRNQIVVAFNLNHADSAGGYLVEILQIAKAWYLNVYGFCCLQYTGALRHADLYFVYSKIYHLSLRPPLNIP